MLHEWNICSSVRPSKCQKLCLKASEVKHAFKDLERACFCCISRCKCSTDRCEKLYPFALTGSSRALISAAFTALWCLCRQMWENGKGGKWPFFRACSEMHTLSALLMALQRRAQFCLDCLRMGSSGHHFATRKTEGLRSKKAFFFFFFLFSQGGQGEGKEQSRYLSELEPKQKKRRK